MQYKIMTMDGQRWDAVEVLSKKELLRAIKSTGLMEGPRYSIRHHDYYSVVYADGKQFLIAESAEVVA